MIRQNGGKEKRGQARKTTFERVRVKFAEEEPRLKKNVGGEIAKCVVTAAGDGDRLNSDVKRSRGERSGKKKRTHLSRSPAPDG